MRNFYKIIKHIVENNKIFIGPKEMFTRPNDFLPDLVKWSCEFGKHCNLCVYGEKRCQIVIILTISF